MAQPTFSFKYVLSEGNYTAVRITVVDLCEQRGEPSQIMLSNIESVPNTCTSESVIAPQTDEVNDNMQHTTNILTGILAFMLLIVAIIIVIALIVVLKRGSKKSAEPDIPVYKNLKLLIQLSYRHELIS